MRKLLYFLICFIFIFSFSCAKKPPPEEAVAEVGEEEFEEEEEFVEEEEVTPTIEEEGTVTPPPVTPPVTPTETMGFRVQILATAYLANAEKVASEARMKFAEKVYVEYIAPYYKVRVGDCVSRGDVSALRIRARQMGYNDAWVVETMVRP